MWVQNRILELKIAIRFLFNRTEEGFISLISLFSFFGIFLGVATLIIVMSVMNGFREKLIGGILGVSGHIKISSSNGSKNQIYNFEEILKKLEEFEKSKISQDLEKKFNLKITYIIPQISGQALLSSQSSVQGVYVLGIRNVKEKKEIHDSILIGKDFDFGGENKEKIMIGARLAESLMIKIGDKISLISPSSESLLIGEVPNSKEFEVASVFETKIFDVDNSLIYMDFDFAKYFFDLDENSASQIEIKTSNSEKSIFLKNELKKFFYESWILDDGEESSKNNLIFSDWSEINGSYLNALNIEKKVMFLILSFIIFVAVFNVVSSLIMLVNEKVRSIAILKTMGLCPSAILRIFLYCGMMISLSGIIFGASFGIIFALNLNNIKNFVENNLGFEVFNQIIYFFKDIPASLNFKDIFYVVFFTIIISLLVIIPPSRKASKKDPASILKYF